MKELEKLDRESEKDGIEIVQQKKKEVELRYLNSLIPNSGHSVFEINPKTLDVVEAEFEVNRTATWHEALQLMSNPDKANQILPDKLLTKTGMVYISALNKENALDRFKKGKGSSGIDFKKALSLKQ